MTDDERAIMGDMFFYLRDHNDPPPISSPGCSEYWLKACRDICSLVSVKWHDHPLATEVALALYSYLDQKCKAKDGGAV